MLGFFRRKKVRGEKEERTFEIYKALVVKRVWMNGYSSDMELYELSRRAVEDFEMFAGEDRRKGGGA